MLKSKQQRELYMKEVCLFSFSFMSTRVSFLGYANAYRGVVWLAG